MFPRLAVALLTVNLLAGNLLAGNLLAGNLLAAPAAGDELHTLVEAYTDGIGWSPSEAGPLAKALQAGLNEAAGGAGSVGPLEAALLLFADRENDLPRVRMLVRYGQVTLRGDGKTRVVSLVEVERYNLGPALRAQAVEEYGEDNVDEVAAFGEGPNVAWRYVFVPGQGRAAELLAAARQEIPDSDTERADCLGRGCLDLAVPLDELVRFDPAEAPPTDWAAPYPAEENGLASPARATAELELHLGVATLIEGEYDWNGLEQPESAPDGTPFLFLQFEKGLGQDEGSDAVLALTELNDAGLYAVWSRRIEVPGSVSWFGAPVRR